MTLRTATMIRLQQRRGTEAGLTLVELLISLVLLVLITGFLAGGVALGRHAFVADRMSTEKNDAARALDTLGALVGAAVPAPASREGLRLAFEGRPETLSFVGLSNGHALPGGALGFAIHRNGGEVEVAISPPPGAAPLRQGQVGNVALHGVAELRLSYFGSPAAGAPPAWQDEWLAMNRLPALVRIQIRFVHSRGDQQVLVVALRQS